MAGRFQDQVVWITGAGSGIGKALALEFAKEGAMIACSGRRVDRLQETMDAVAAVGGQAKAIACDVTNDASLQKAATQAAQAWNGLDVVVANAGFSISGRVEKLSADEWQRQLSTNVTGAVMTATHALPHLKERRGRIAFVSSVAGIICFPGSAAYSASKFALRAIGLTLAQELHTSGVSVTNLYPGFIESEIAQVSNEGVFRPEAKDPRPQQLMWKADKAARNMVRAIYKRKLEHVITFHGHIGAFLGKHFTGLVHFLFRRTSLR